MSILAVAPMDGITNNAFRQISNKLWNKYWDKNHQMMMRTEFMSTEWYVRQPRRLSHHLLTDSSQDNVIAQIYGWDADHLLQTAIDIDQKYSDFAGIELNIWCPSPKIYACESWVGMLRNRPKTSEIIKSISQNIKKPFSIKTRTWLNELDKEAQFEWLLSVAEYCDMITIHGRTYKDGHSGPVDREYIYELKAALSNKTNIHGRNIKILWNGWINTYEDGICRIANLDGVMRWQSVMKNPFVMTNHKPELDELRSIILEHFDIYIADDIYMTLEDSFDNQSNLLIEPNEQIYSQIIFNLKNKSLSKYTFHQDQNSASATRSLIDVNSWNRHSVMEFRKHLFWYVNWLPGNKEFKQKLATIHNYFEAADEINKFFDNIGA